MNKFCHGQMYLLIAIIIGNTPITAMGLQISSTVLVHRCLFFFFLKLKRLFLGIVFLDISKGYSRDSDLLWDSFSARQGCHTLSLGRNGISKACGFLSGPLYKTN